MLTGEFQTSVAFSLALQLNLLSELIRLDGAPQMTALVVKTRQNGWSLLDGAPLA